MIPYHNPLSVLMLVKCYVQRHYDEESMAKREKTGRYVLLVKKPCFVTGGAEGEPSA
ncbi:hypothetical protein AOX84_00055 [Salmonella enterica subsp. enterica serovar Paratyphi B]|nr:hypothetical protein AL030_12595 [Salmonella enterica subsp. enterica serovar Paratyphi B]KOO96729.1 hypothetical protein AL029_12600 [Salmonella enterica subsp. enterica serovar Paratyphi B]KTA20050.1 hypothetical protein AOX75_19595 [Salmonella enterica subsp. enterica serovar Paratyphi B]KTA24862.1 hypothetical protein AOX76_15010 [Salmonella enterica subsp. enterica serovar Paratyphi B]KZB12558.1 hypothetical protein AOX81_00055 [Salmonella enterica subsp. enterica serovar Paratyphi B]